MQTVCTQFFLATANNLTNKQVVGLRDILRVNALTSQPTMAPASTAVNKGMVLGFFPLFPFFFFFVNDGILRFSVTTVIVRQNALSLVFFQELAVIVLKKAICTKIAQISHQKSVVTVEKKVRKPRDSRLTVTNL